MNEKFLVNSGEQEDMLSAGKVAAVAAVMGLLAQLLYHFWPVYLMTASPPLAFVYVSLTLQVLSAVPFSVLAIVMYRWGRSVDLSAQYHRASIGLFLGGVVGGELGAFLGPILIAGGTWTGPSSASIPDLLLFSFEEVVGGIGLGLATFFPGFAGFVFGSLRKPPSLLN